MGNYTELPRSVPATLRSSCITYSFSKGQMVKAMDPGILTFQPVHLTASLHHILRSKPCLCYIEQVSLNAGLVWHQHGLSLSSTQWHISGKVFSQ